MKKKFHLPLGRFFRSMMMLSAISLCLEKSDAGWYRNIFPEDKSPDILMLDFYFPYWAETTYYAFWNVNFAPKGGYFYGGVSANTPPESERSNYSPGSVWSFWGHPAYEDRQIRNIYVNPLINTQQYIGEGASGTAYGQRLPWIKEKQWYTMTLRLWGTNEENKEAFIGQWQKDQKNNEWHHIGTFRIPYAATGLQSNSGFLEDFGHTAMKPREIWRGKGFIRTQNKWEKTNQIDFDVPKDDGATYIGWTVQEQQEGKALSMSYTSNRALGANLACGQKHTRLIQQAETPELTPPSGKAKAHLLDNQLLLEWTLDKHSTPQLGFRIEVFDNPEHQGTPISKTLELIPHQRIKALTLPKAKGYFPKFTLIDIFDQTSEIPIEITGNTHYIPAVAANVREGLYYSYVEKEGGWLSLKDVDFSQPLRTGLARELDISLRNKREGGSAFLFEGYLKVPETGSYTFSLRSCDGSRLELGGKEIINADGIHSCSEISGGCFLQKGLVPIKLTYFKKEAAPVLTVLWLGWARQNKPLEEIPAEAFASKTEKNDPSATLASENKNEQLELSVKTDIKEINQIRYLNGSKCIADVSTPPFEAKVPLFQGENRFHARLTYQNNKTIDTGTIKVMGQNTSPPDWTFTVLGEKTLPHGFQTKENHYSFTGEGEYFLNKPIKGDFELGVHITKTKTVDDGIGTDAWVGLMVKQNLNPDNYELGIYRTARYGVRTGANHSDLGTTRMSSYELPKDLSYFKMTRSGKRFLCWGSTNGKDWKLCYERYIPPYGEDVYAGLTLRATPGLGNVIYSAEVDSLYLKPGTPPTVPVSVDADIFPGKIMGYSLLNDHVSVSREREKITLLERKADGSITSMKMNLPEGTGSVRSVAYDGKTMLLLAAKGESASVFRSEDMGKTWMETLPGLALDKNPANQIAGELLAFDPRNSGQCVVGSEKTGVYYSSDSGKIWSSPLLKGESITDIGYSPLFNGYVYISSFDRENKCSRLFEQRNLGTVNEQRIEIPSVGILKILFDKRLSWAINLLTTNGHYHSHNGGADFIRTVHDISADSMYVAGDGMDQKETTNYWIASADGKNLYYGFYYGLNWSPIANLPDWGNALQIQVDQKDRNHVFIYAEKGIYETPDSGKTWKKLY